MRWAINTALAVNAQGLKTALEKSRDAFLAANPKPSNELDRIQELVRQHPGFQEQLDKHVAANPHSPELVAMIDRAIAAAVLVAPEVGEVHASVSGYLTDAGACVVSIAVEAVPVEA